MRKNWYIMCLLILIVGVAASAYADDYIDDAYYWDTPSSATAASAPSYNNQSDTYSSEETYTDDDAVASPAPEITFIEDSVTRSTNTVIKAVIKRN